MTDNHENNALVGTSIAENDFPESFDVKKYECDECQISFPNRLSFINHKRTHSAPKPYNCDECEFTTTKASLLKVHQQTHSAKKFNCEECGFLARSKSLLKAHEFEHVVDKSKFNCEYCNYANADRKLLEVHRKAHPFKRDLDEKLWRCVECDFVASQPHELKIHQTDHEGEKPFVCPQCECAFNARDSLISHFNNHARSEFLFNSTQSGKSKKKKKWSCYKCSYSTKFVVALKSHIKKHNSAKETYSCEYCNFLCLHSWDLESHKLVHLDDSGNRLECDNNMMKRDDTDDILKCEKCSFLCTSRSILERHALCHEDYKPFKCEECDFASQWQRGLKCHVRVHLRKTPRIGIKSEPSDCTSDKQSECETDFTSDQQPKYETQFTSDTQLKYEPDDKASSARLRTRGNLIKCNQCDFECLSVRQLQSHRLTHSERKPWSCEHCEYVTSEEANFRKHQKVHLTTDKFQCDRCDFTCGQFWRLTCHRRVEHMGKLPWKCEECDFSCKNTSALKAHYRRTHAGSSLFQCNQCDVRCQSLEILKRHQDEHNFKCCKCDFVSKKHSKMKRHMRIHTSETLYQCVECNFVSGKESSFLKHQLIHSGDKPYKCDECQRTFRFNSILYLHKSRYHSDGAPEVDFSPNKPIKTETGDDTEMCEQTSQNNNDKASKGMDPIFKSSLQIKVEPVDIISEDELEPTEMEILGVSPFMLETY